MEYLIRNNPAESRYIHIQDILSTHSVIRDYFSLIHYNPVLRSANPGYGSETVGSKRPNLQILKLN